MKEKEMNLCPKKILCIPAEEILHHYGFEHQVEKTIEEIGELLEAIDGSSYWWRDGMPLSEEDRAALLTECADVIVMVAQLLRLDAVLYPVNMEAHPKFLERLIVAYRDEVLAMGGVSLDPRLHFGRDIIEEAIRLAVSIAGKEELQEEILFKIRRQTQRIAGEIAEAKTREALAKMERAAIRAAELEAKRAAKNAAKIAASTKKE
jgi:NTP pyrophosphatase (non-canonical NTP hydrolase)